MSLLVGDFPLEKTFISNKTGYKMVAKVDSNHLHSGLLDVFDVILNTYISTF